MEGPGKYDMLSEALMEVLRAQVVLVAVLGGPRGDGVSMKEIVLKTPELQRKQRIAIVGVLRQLIAEMERELGL